MTHMKKGPAAEGRASLMYQLLILISHEVQEAEKVACLADRAWR